MARFSIPSVWLLVVSVTWWLHVASCQGTPELDRESLEKLLASDRAGMIKFYQPWCGHSKRMKPDWDLLAEHFEEDSSIFIADVNCQIEESLCSGYHPGGTYPTVLVFPRPTSNSGKPSRPPAELYQGARGFENLKKFVDQTLALSCSIQRPEETCSDRARAYIAKWKVKDRNDQQKELVRLKAMIQPDAMTYDLSKWVSDRIGILEQLITTKEQGDEL